MDTFWALRDEANYPMRRVLVDMAMVLCYAAGLIYSLML